MKHVSDQIAGVNTINMLCDRAQGARQPQPSSDDLGDLYGSCGHQPDALSLIKVQLGERPSARPDPVGHRLVEDLLTQCF